MRGQDHYTLAESLLGSAKDEFANLTHSERMRYIAAAHAHAALATAAAQSAMVGRLTRILRAWEEEDRKAEEEHQAEEEAAARPAEPLVTCGQTNGTDCTLPIGHHVDIDNCPTDRGLMATPAPSFTPAEREPIGEQLAAERGVSLVFGEAPVATVLAAEAIAAGADL